MIHQKKIKILHTALSVQHRINQILDTAKMLTVILSDQYTDDFFVVVGAGTDQEETGSSDKKQQQYVGFQFSDHFLFPYFFNLQSILYLQLL